MRISARRRWFGNGAVAAILIATALAAPDAHATYPNVLGQYGGTGTETRTVCGPPDSGTFTGSAFLNIDDQQSNQFTGKGFVVESSETFTITSASINTSGAVSGNWSASDGSSGTFSGTLSGDTLSVSYTGGGGVDGCTVNGSVTLSRGATLVPETSAPAEILIVQSLGAFSRAFGKALGARFQSFRLASSGFQATQVANGFDLSGSTGLSAGDGAPYPYGLWGSFTYTDTEDDFAFTEFDSTRYNILGGADISPIENLYVGVAVGYEHSDVETVFNRGEADTDGLTVAPYASYLVNDMFSIDVSVGRSWLGTDQFRTAPGGTTRITSDVKSQRTFYTGNANLYRTWGNWFVTGRIGGLWASESLDGFTESDGTINPTRRAKLGQFRFGFDAAYAMGNWEPYATATYEHDFELTEVVLAGVATQPANDRDGVVGGFGVRYFGDNGVTGALEYQTVFGREDLTEHFFNFVLRADF